eukprot:m.503281 g.503281  ORF g.503281 m.503281 type:complete len:228 (+) comp21845_c0_seq3:153-836(+)
MHTDILRSNRVLIQVHESICKKATKGSQRRGTFKVARVATTDDTDPTLTPSKTSPRKKSTKKTPDAAKPPAGNRSPRKPTPLRTESPDVPISTISSQTHTITPAWDTSPADSQPQRGASAAAVTTQPAAASPAGAREQQTPNTNASPGPSSHTTNETEESILVREHHQIARSTYDLHPQPAVDNGNSLRLSLDGSDSLDDASPDFRQTQDFFRFDCPCTARWGCSCG